MHAYHRIRKLVMVVDVHFQGVICMNGTYSLICHFKG